MSTNINTLTHSLRERLASSGSPVKLGHTHQLVAAALGYTSLAVLQASREPEDLSDSMHWIVDVRQLEERAASLELVIDASAFVHLLAQASRECGGPQIHASDDEMADDLVNVAQEAALDDQDVAREMAMTNCTGPWDAYLEFSGSSIDRPAQIGAQFDIDYEGQVQGEQDEDRPYSGHSVDVTVQLSFVTLGKRLVLGPPKPEIIRAMLNDGYYAEHAESPSTYSRLEAIAIELGIPVSEHEQLEGAEIDGDTTSAGVPNGYLVSIKYCAPSPVIDRLRADHPTQEIWVLGTAFDQISPFERT